MQIVQLMLSKGFGGAERYFVELSRALAADSHQVTAIYHERFCKRELLAGHANITCRPVRVRGAWDLLAGYAIRRQIAAARAQVIHAHLARGAKFGAAAGHKLGIPVTVKLHNFVNLKYYRQIDKFITTTPDQSDYLIRHGIAAERMTQIPNFSAIAPVDRPPQTGTKAPVFAAIGRMVIKKGFDPLIRAFSQYLKKGGQGRLIVGGDGPEAGTLRVLAANSGLGNNIEFSGWVNDVPGFLQSADVFVLPSLDEPFGIVLLEAMACGKSIISTRTQGPRNILSTDTAWLVGIGDVDDLANAMQLAADDPAGRLQRARLALEQFRKHYSTDAVVPRIVELYEALTLRQ